MHTLRKAYGMRNSIFKTFFSHIFGIRLIDPDAWQNLRISAPHQGSLNVNVYTKNLRLC